MATKKNKSIEVTTAEYMKLRGTRNLSAINRAIRKGWKLEGVQEVKTFGRTNVLVVSVDRSGRLVTE